MAWVEVVVKDTLKLLPRGSVVRQDSRIERVPKICRRFDIT